MVPLVRLPESGRTHNAFHTVSVLDGSFTKGCCHSAQVAFSRSRGIESKGRHKSTLFQRSRVAMAPKPSLPLSARFSHEHAATSELHLTKTDEKGPELIFKLVTQEQEARSDLFTVLRK